MSIISQKIARFDQDTSVSRTGEVSGIICFNPKRYSWEILIIFQPRNFMRYTGVGVCLFQDFCTNYNGLYLCTHRSFFVLTDQNSLLVIFCLTLFEVQNQSLLGAQSISKHALHTLTDGCKTVFTVDFFCDLLVIPLRASATSGLRQATRLWAWREMAAVSRMVSLFCPTAHTQQLELFPGSWDTFSFLLTEESVTSV